MLFILDIRCQCVEWKNFVTVKYVSSLLESLQYLYSHWKDYSLLLKEHINIYVCKNHYTIAMKFSTITDMISMDVICDMKNYVYIFATFTLHLY